MKISNGIIMNQEGRKIGTATKEFKNGYHPAVMAVVGCYVKWFELDEPDLLAKIGDFAREYEHGGPDAVMDQDSDPGCMCCPDCTDGPDCPYCGEDYIQHLEKMEEQDA